MDDIQGYAFYEKVKAYLRGDLSIEELDRWIVEQLPSLMPPRDDAVSELAGLIQLWVSEVNQGHRAPDEVRSLLQEALRRQGAILVSVHVGKQSDTGSANDAPPFFMWPAEAQVLSASRR